MTYHLGKENHRVLWVVSIAHPSVYLLRLSGTSVFYATANIFYTSIICTDSCSFTVCFEKITKSSQAYGILKKMFDSGNRRRSHNPSDKDIV